MEEDAAARVYADPLARWFVTEAYRITDTGELIAQAGEQLVRAGIPLYRMAYFQGTLHPEFAGTGYFWRRGRGVVVQSAQHGLFESDAFLDNPLPVVLAQRKTVRVHLEQVEPQAPVLRQLKDEGATDYVALPLIFSTGHTDALTVSSDKPGGFSSDDLDRMFLLQFAFTRLVEVHSLRDTAVNLLNAYVGHAAGQRILAGEVKRGGGQTLEAVIWYCDLRGFTRTSDRLPRDTVIALLNDYFGAMGAAVSAAGGEILKFMGDGMLAMFPIAGSVQRRHIALRAAQAAREAERAVTELNQRRAETGDSVVRFGLALHVGEVNFGNIGASTRLDFTVIGPAVNYAARLERVCVDSGRSIVLSSDLAALLPEGEVTPIGTYTLKDIDAPQAVFGLE